jgi:hypothetical protein
MADISVHEEAKMDMKPLPDPDKVAEAEANKNADAENELDLGKLDKPPVARHTPATIEWHNHNLRAKIALRLTYAVIILTVVPIIAVVFRPQGAPALKDIGAAIIPATIGIYGTIIGFYFGGAK